MATKSKSTKSGEFDAPSVIPGVTLSRTLAPVQPANFLARHNLIDVIDVSAPGTTLIVGPVGYGKTYLATELAQRYIDRTFWYTMVDEDSPGLFKAHVIQAVRNVIPGFAPWFENEPKIDPMELIVRFGNELATHKGNYIFIVDNRRTAGAQDFAIANQMIRSLPRNLHLVQIRRNAPEASSDELAPFGNLQIIGPSDLRFTCEEVQAIASLNGLAPVTAEITEILQSAQGWPAAVQLIARGLSKGESFSTSANEIANSIEPLKLIVNEVVRNLSEDEKQLLMPLSTVKEFNRDFVYAIHGESAPVHKLDDLAAEGSLLTKTAELDPQYQIHSLIREVLYQEFSKNSGTCRLTHGLVSLYYEKDLQHTLALEHAFLAQDFLRFEELFRAGARLYSVTGRGRDLLRWAKYAGDESIEGQIKRQTVEVAGHLANLDFEKVEALVSNVVAQSRGTQLESFIDRYSALIEIGMDFIFARFEKLKISGERATRDHELARDHDFTDALYALRRLGAYYFVIDNLAELEIIESKAKSLLEERFSQIGHVHQLAISAMTAYLQGYYQTAQNISRMTISLSEKIGMIGIHAPLDAHYVSARCAYEFTEHEDALEAFYNLSDLSASSQQWIWHFMAESYIANDFAVKGKTEQAIEIVGKAREKVKTIPFTNQLMSIVDRSELFVRLMMKDLPRMKILVETALEGRLVENARLHILDLEDKPWASPEASDLPDRTPREKLYKLIAQAVLAGVETQKSKEIVIEALRLGSEVGAKETFLREIVLFPIYIRIAVETPTFYHEEIARGAMKRMQELNAATNAKPELTKREIEIVRHLESGKPITSIGASLHISHNTMKTHLKNVYRKLGVEGRDQAVEKAKSLGLI